MSAMNWNDAAEDFLNQVLAQTPRPVRDETERQLRAPALAGVHPVDLVGTRSAAAMLHAGNHVELVPVVLLVAHFLQNARMIIDAVFRRDELIVPAVVYEELAAVRFEFGEVRIDGVD